MSNPKLSSSEHKSDKAGLYNFSKLKKSRKWLKVCIDKIDRKEIENIMY